MLFLPGVVLSLLLWLLRKVFPRWCIGLFFFFLLLLLLLLLVLLLLFVCFSFLLVCSLFSLIPCMFRLCCIIVVEFLLCYKTVSADNSFWISTLYKYGVLYMKTYLNTSFVLTSYLFSLIFTTGDSNSRDSVGICLQLLILLTVLFVCLFSLFSFFLLFASWILHTVSVLCSRTSTNIVCSIYFT